MAWRAHEGRWPNGRRFWTVEDRRSKPARAQCGDKGGVTRYHDYHMALCEVSRLATSDKPPAPPKPKPQAWHPIDCDDRF